MRQLPHKITIHYATAYEFQWTFAVTPIVCPFVVFRVAEYGCMLSETSHQNMNDCSNLQK